MLPHGICRGVRRDRLADAARGRAAGGAVLDGSAPAVTHARRGAGRRLSPAGHAAGDAYMVETTHVRLTERAWHSIACVMTRAGHASRWARCRIARGWTVRNRADRYGSRPAGAGVGGCRDGRHRGRTPSPGLAQRAFQRQDRAPGGSDAEGSLPVMLAAQAAGTKHWMPWRPGISRVRSAPIRWSTSPPAAPTDLHQPAERVP